MMAEKFFFIVKTGYHDRMRDMCILTDSENERISSEAIGDLYESDELDLVGFYDCEKHFSYRSEHMKTKHSEFIDKVFDLNNEDYLVFESNNGTIDHVNDYVINMKYCHVFKGEIYVRGFKKVDDVDYVYLEFGTEAG